MDLIYSCLSDDRNASSLNFYIHVEYLSRHAFTRPKLFLFSSLCFEANSLTPLYSRCQLGSKRNRDFQATRKTMPFSFYTPAIGTKRPHKKRCSDMRPFERAHQMCLPNEIRPRRAFRMYLVCGKLK